MKELNTSEIALIVGGVNWTKFGAGVGIVVLGLAVVATGPIGIAAVSLAASVSPLIASTAVVTAGVGSYIATSALQE